MPKPATAAAKYIPYTIRIPRPLFESMRAEAERIGRPFNTHLIWTLLHGHKHAPELLELPPEFAALKPEVALARDN